jgi:hypothetical protein
VYRNIDNTAEMADAWEDLRQLVAESALPTTMSCQLQSSRQAAAPPGVALIITSREMPRSGPLSARSGWHPSSCSATPSTAARH